MLGVLCRTRRSRGSLIVIISKSSLPCAKISPASPGRFVMSSQKTAWTSTVWGSGGANTERLALSKGDETCHICMEARVEVAMQPCKHQICLECCNRLRAANIFKVRNITYSASGSAFISIFVYIVFIIFENSGLFAG